MNHEASFSPSIIYIWFEPIATVCLKYNKLCFCLFIFSWGGAVWGTDAVHLYCSLYCIYLGSKLWFLHIYLDYHRETGQLIIIKQLCQKMFYHFDILYWLLNKHNFRGMDVHHFSQDFGVSNILYSDCI